MRRASMLKKSMPSTAATAPSRKSPMFSCVMPLGNIGDFLEGAVAAVDGSDEVGGYLDLAPTQRVYGGTYLPVHIRQLKPIKIGQRKASKPDPGQREHVSAAHTAETGHCHAGASYSCLLSFGKQSDVARKCLAVVKAARPARAHDRY